MVDDGSSCGFVFVLSSFSIPALTYVKGKEAINVIGSRPLNKCVIILRSVHLVYKLLSAS